ncbi:flagellar assembly protein FliW [Mesobacillus harenae]|uniref:flagellar assembly protein FliW n=1 Tax=Mesobacillus harenae TaxID=2213203 RepID=UPI001580D437|nr:flagellar assembly protein FliW [Mesobacillus harenae]
MKLQTKYHSEIEIDEKDILTFEKGLPGFSDEKKFIVLPLTEEQIYFSLQSLTTPQLAFIVANPFVFFKSYDFKLEDGVVEELAIESDQDVQVYSVLTVEDPFSKTTANLQAPVIVNMKNKRAKQVILHGETYKTKHPIFENTKATSAKG